MIGRLWNGWIRWRGRNKSISFCERVDADQFATRSMVYFVYGIWKSIFNRTCWQEYAWADGSTCALPTAYAYCRRGDEQRTSAEQSSLGLPQPVQANEPRVTASQRGFWRAYLLLTQPKKAFGSASSLNYRWALFWSESAKPTLSHFLSLSLCKGFRLSSIMRKPNYSASRRSTKPSVLYSKYN